MGRKIYTVLQLRVHPELLKLREELHAQPKNRKREVVLTYVAARGGWYHGSWKGSEIVPGVSERISESTFSIC